RLTAYRLPCAGDTGAGARGWERLRDRTSRVGTAEGSEWIVVETGRIRTTGGNAGCYQHQHRCPGKEPRTQDFRNPPHRTRLARRHGGRVNALRVNTTLTDAASAAPPRVR